MRGAEGDELGEVGPQPAVTISEGSSDDESAEEPPVQVVTAWKMERDQESRAQEMADVTRDVSLLAPVR